MEISWPTKGFQIYSFCDANGQMALTHEGRAIKLCEKVIHDVFFKIGWMFDPTQIHVIWNMYWQN
jgi:hypothetical protein